MAATRVDGPDDGHFSTAPDDYDGVVPEEALPPEARTGQVERLRAKPPQPHLKLVPPPSPSSTSKVAKPQPQPPAPKAAKSKSPKKLTPSAPKPVEPNWQRSLTLTQNGRTASSHANAVTILRNDRSWQGAVAYDVFAGRIMKLRPIKWHKFDRPAKQYRKPGPWTDLDTCLLRNWFEREYEMLLKPADVATAVDTFARSNVISGPRDYLRPLVWDGVARLDLWLIVYGGAESTNVNRAVGAMWMISAVARAFQPGCQVDHSVVFEGDQGIGKSSMLRILCPDPAWFLIDIGSEFGKLDSFQKLRGKWIIEMSELDSLGRSALAGAKAFMTAPVDSYRKSYGRETEDHPRRCVFAGTTNKEEYLTDETGNRRFWPVTFTKVNLAALKRDRDQLWAEAVARYRTGEPWHITDPDLLAAVKVVQERRVQTDPWERFVAGHLIKPDVQRDGVTTHELLVAVFKMKPADINRAEEMRTAAVLKKLGWACRVKDRKWVGKHRVRRYFPIA